MPAQSGAVRRRLPAREAPRDHLPVAPLPIRPQHRREHHESPDGRPAFSRRGSRRFDLRNGLTVRFRLLAAAAVSLALIGAGPATGTPVNIDVILPLTGAQAFAGHIHQETLQVYEKWANVNGGLY